MAKTPDKPLAWLHAEIKTSPFSSKAGSYDEVIVRNRSMDKRTRKRLESAGWKVGDVSEFLSLTDEEAAIVELKVGLANAVKEQRRRRSLTQQQLGRLLGSSQSRVAKMEAADPSVSIDLMVRTLLRMGASRAEVASYIVTPSRRRAA